MELFALWLMNEDPVDGSSVIFEQLFFNLLLFFFYCFVSGGGFGHFYEILGLNLTIVHQKKHIETECKTLGKDENMDLCSLSLLYVLLIMWLILHNPSWHIWSIFYISLMFSVTFII